jgi:hypothetical protein
MAGDFTIKPGDIVSHDGEEYVVVSQTTYRGPRATWREWMLRFGAGDEWLVLVAADRQLLTGSTCSLRGSPGEEVLDVAGESFRVACSGKADVETLMDSGATGFDRVEFWQYAQDTGPRLFVTRSRGVDRALLLQPTDPIGFEVYGV